MDAKEAVMSGGSRHVPARSGRPTGRGPARKQGKPQPRPAEAGSAPARPTGPPPDTDRIITVAAPVVHALNMDLESVKVTSAGRRRLLRIVVDSDHGLSLDDAAQASRELSAKLDASDVMGDLPYTLEVSSPGVDRPLTQPRHWQRALGRLVRVPLPGSGSVQGRIVAADADQVVLDVDDTHRRFGYADLGAGKIQIEFDRPNEGPDTGEPDGH
jgi:ribosome maturation factor RimP